MKIAKAKALDHVYGLLPRRWGVNERHGAMSLWELIRISANNWIQTCFWAWERMAQLWFAFALTGIIPYHTVAALQKKAQGSQRCFRRWSGGVKRLSACSLPGDADDAIRIYCKTIKWSPKNDNFDPKSHFSIEVLPIAHIKYIIQYDFEAVFKNQQQHGSHDASQAFGGPKARMIHEGPMPHGYPASSTRSWYQLAVWMVKTC